MPRRTILSKARFLLDVNVLVALADEEHEHHSPAMRWFSAAKRDWGVCPLTETGFVRVATRCSAGRRTIQEVIAVYEEMTRFPGYRFWPIAEKWTDLVKPFAARLFGHNQITDACLLGLAVKENAVLVTFDQGIRFLAGQQFAGNVLVLP